MAAPAGRGRSVENVRAAGPRSRAVDPGGVSCSVQLHHRLDGGVQAPEIGPSQGPDVEDVHALIGIDWDKLGPDRLSGWRSRPGASEKGLDTGADDVSAMPSAHAAPTAASTLSKRLVGHASPATKGMSDSGTSGDSSPALARINSSPRTNTARPPRARCSAITGRVGIDGKEDHLAITQAAPFPPPSDPRHEAPPRRPGRTTSTWVRNTWNTCSGLLDVVISRNAARARSRSPRRPGSGHRPGPGPGSHPRCFPAPRPPPSGSSTPGCRSCQLPQSPGSTLRRSRNNPSPQARPVNFPPSRRNSATRCATSVVPLEPVMPTTGMRPVSPSGNK